MKTTWSREEIDALKEFCNEHIEEIFEVLSIEPIDRGNYYNSRCPIHNGDNPTGWSWHKDLGTWKCFTKGCHNCHGGDIIGLYSGLRDIPFKSAIDELSSIVEFEITPEKIEAAKCKRVVRTYKESYKPVAKKTLDRGLLSKLVKDKVYEDYLVGERGFALDIVGDAAPGRVVNSRSDFRERIIFPVLDEDGDFVAFTGRWPHRSRPTMDAKWMHHGEINDYLYGFDVAQKHINDSQTVIITEGPLKVLRLRQAGFFNAVAVFGTSISRRQQRLLLGVGAFNAILALDNDDAGRAFTKKIQGIKQGGLYDNLSRYMRTVEADLRRYSDIDEMPPEEVKEVIDECKSLL